MGRRMGERVAGVSAEQRLREQLRARTTLLPASHSDEVICCGHDLAAHDDDGCTVGWEPAGHLPLVARKLPDGCPCRVRGWAQ